MIYEIPGPEEPIKQGDIFFPLPFTQIDLGLLSTFDRETLESHAVDWNEFGHTGVTKPMVIPVEPIWGIVASQDCEANHSPNVSFYKIVKLSEVPGFSTSPTTEWFAKWIPKISRDPKFVQWFYLPADQSVGFSEKMAVNLETLSQVKISSLNANLSLLRKGRLKDPALQHFQETVSHFYGRYAFNEWYNLTAEEFEVYKRNNPEAQPEPHQVRNDQSQPQPSQTT